MKLRRRSIVIGLLFIAAAVFAVLGLLSYDPILNNAEYLIDGPTMHDQIVLGAVFELLTAAAVAGTALAFYPILKRYAESIALGYVAFRTVEAILIIVGAISMLTLLTLRQDVAGGAAFDGASLLAADSLLRSIHSLTMILGPNFMLAINTALYSYVLYRTRLVPRPLAMLGYDICEEMAAVRDSIGIVFQEPAVDEDLTGAEKNQNRPADSDRRLARNRRNTRRRT